MGQLCPFFLSSLLYYKYLIVCSSIGPNNGQSTPEYSSLDSESLFCCDSEIASAQWVYSPVTKPITAKQQALRIFHFLSSLDSLAEFGSVLCLTLNQNYLLLFWPELSSLS
jgi:hypothetical protein